MIRFIKENELETLIELCVRHADYEQCAYDRRNKKERLRQAIFDDCPSLYCLVAIENDVIVGYASYMPQYSTWDARFYTYLDCLYLDQQARGKAIGQQLMHRVREESLKTGCDLIQWQTPVFNVGAIRFYKRLGAISKSKERFYMDISIK